MIDASAPIARYQGAADENPCGLWIDRVVAAVRRYRSAGFRCIPLKPRDKEPVENDRMGSAFAVRASAVERTIRDAFERNPGANLGLLIEGGVVVLDLDVRHGGAASWERLTAGVEMPETATAETGCRECEPIRGRHYLFKLPADAGPIRGKLTGFEGVEIESAGYIVVEPSIHPKSGVAYRWIVWPDDGIAELPAEILAKIRKPPAAPGSAKAGHRRLRAADDLPSLRDEIAARYPIEGFGQRNGRTIQAVGSLAGRGFDDATILAVVVPHVVEAARAGRSQATERKAADAVRDVIASTRRNPDFVVNDSAEAIWAAIDAIELAAWQTDAIAGEFGTRRRADDTPLTRFADDDAKTRDPAKTKTSGSSGLLMAIMA